MRLELVVTGLFLSDDTANDTRDDSDSQQHVVAAASTAERSAVGTTAR